MSTVIDEDDDTASTAPEKAPGKGFAADTRLSCKRWLVKTSRNPFVTFSSLVQPIVFFVLMTEVFGAIASGTLSQSVGSDVTYVTYLTPAIVIQSTLAAAAVSGIGLVNDMESGLFEKTLVSPMNRGAMFLGKLLSEIVRIVVQTTIILCLGYGLLALTSDASVGSYLRTGVGGLVGILALTVLFGGAFMAFSNIVALVTRDQEATIMIANLLTFPLLFVSSAFLPLEVLPEWIRGVSVINPVTYGVDGIRAFMLGRDVLTGLDVTAFTGLWNTVVPAIVVLVGFNVVLSGIAVWFLTRAARVEVL